VDISNITVEKIRAACSAKGYAFFDGNKSFNLNIIGIRASSHQSNSFDDGIVVAYRDHNLDWTVDRYTVTTDPGKKYLKRTVNVKGAAILLPGQYRSVYHIGLHRGSYKALCQRGGPVRVWRDNNKDEILDHDVEIEKGWFGINIHRAHAELVLESVNGYSAGCQVFSSPQEFAYFMAICECAETLFGNSFTYTLFDESDFFDDLV
jgi:hypothetical protein